LVERVGTLEHVEELSGRRLPARGDDAITDVRHGESSTAIEPINRVDSAIARTSRRFALVAPCRLTA